MSDFSMEAKTLRPLEREVSPEPKPKQVAKVITWEPIPGCVYSTITFVSGEKAAQQDGEDAQSAKGTAT